PVAPLILDHVKEADGVDHRLVKISRGSDLSCKVQFRIRPVNRICRRGVAMDNTQLTGRQVSLRGEVHSRRPQLVNVRLLSTGHPLRNRSRWSIPDRADLRVSLILDAHGLTSSGLQVEVVPPDIKRYRLKVRVDLGINLSSQFSTSTAIHTAHHCPRNTALTPRLVRCGPKEHRDQGNSARTIDGTLHSPITQVLPTGQSDVLARVVQDNGERIPLLIPPVDGHAGTETTRHTSIPEPRSVKRAEAPRNDRRLTNARIASREGHEMAPVDEHTLKSLIELIQEPSLLELLIHLGVVLGFICQHVAFKLDPVGQGSNSLPTPAQDGHEVFVLRIDGDAEVLEFLLSCVVSPTSDIPLLLIGDLPLHLEE